MKWVMAGTVVAAAAALAQAQPVVIEGVAFEPAVQVAGQRLELNGAGLRTRFFVDVYAAALYVPQRTNSAPALLAQQGPRRVVIAMLRDVGVETFSAAISDGLAANHTPAQLQGLAVQIDALQGNLRAVGEVRQGDRIHFEFDPAAGTRILVNGQSKGAVIPGPELFRAMLRVWLGATPVDAGLKQALLGI
jgi:hypothetical protein